jgi:glutathione S-transferase
MLAPKELLAIHPLGKCPMITDGLVTLAESGAIIGKIQQRDLRYSPLTKIEYIIDRYGRDKIQVPPSGFCQELYWESQFSFLSIHMYSYF